MGVIWTYRRCKGSQTRRSSKAVPPRPEVGRGDEGEGEVGGFREGAGGRGRAVRRIRRAEQSVEVGVEEAEDGRGVEGPEAGAADDAVEGGADRGGAGEVLWGVEAAEDVVQDIVGERRRRRHCAAVGRGGRTAERSGRRSDVSVCHSLFTAKRVGP